MQKHVIRAAARIRRRLFLCALACVAGVYASTLAPHLFALAAALCAAFALAGTLFARRLSGAFFCRAAAFFCIGFALAGHVLCVRDVPTQPGARLSGRVKRIVSENRVVLEDVCVEDADAGESRTLNRPAAVTLMLEEGETRDAVAVGQTVEGTGRLFAQEEPRNPGGRDWRIQALCDGYELSGYILPGWTAQGEAVFSLTELFRRARQAALEGLERVFGEDAPLYQALLLGDKGGMEADVVRSMRLTGIAHLLAVSGLHLSIVAAALDALLSFLGGRRLRAAAKAALLCAYAALTGGAPGTIRALIMALMRELAALRGRRYDPLTALAAAALLMTLIRPVWPLGGSFLFSFYVVLGILLLGGEIDRLLARRLPGRIGEWLNPLFAAVSVSASAQLAALPVQLMFYGYAPLLALPMNLAAGVLAPLLMGVGALCLAAGTAYIPLGAALAGVLAVPGRLFERACVAAAALPGGILRLPAPYGVWIAAAALLMALCSGRIAWRRKTKRLRPALALLLALLYLPRFCPAARYVQLDVGQGDAAVLRSGRRAVLVDVGPADSYAALDYLRHEGLAVEAVVLSHLDEDHAGALGTLLSSEVRVGGLVMPADAREDDGSQAVLAALDLAADLGVPVREALCGDAFEAAGARFDVLSPDGTLTGDNERSLLLLARTEGVRLLLTGDLPTSAEPESPPDCDVLKVAHHGSKNATSRAFLEAATPELALISVGAGNRYGHPTQRVLDDLRAVGAAVYRTDESGCLTLWLHGGDWHIQTYIRPGAS